MLGFTVENPLDTTPSLPPLVSSLEQWSRDTKPGLLGKWNDKLEELTTKVTTYEGSRERYNKLRSSDPASGRNSLPHWKELKAEYDTGAKALDDVMIAFGHLGKVSTKVKGASGDLFAKMSTARTVVAADRLQYQQAVGVLQNGTAAIGHLQGKSLPPLHEKSRWSHSSSDDEEKDNRRKLQRPRRPQR